MRVVAADFGRARTGIAVSDPHGITCRPLPVVHERDVSQLIERILAIVTEFDADRIVVGLPRPLSGGSNAQVEHTMQFVETLADRTTVEIVTWDERFTSVLAERGRGRNAPAADSVAACHLLQSYLDACAIRTAESAGGSESGS